MKKLINQVEDVVKESLEGVVLCHPDHVRKLSDWYVLVRKDAPIKGKVALISGGGAGHEPAFWGCIGEGMIDGAVQGEVFTSPTPDHIYEALKAVDGGAGVIQIYNNYTGDVLNFDMAQEMAREEGIEVATILVNDDVAVEDSTFTTGRRGIAGNFFVQKVAGAAAAKGLPFDKVLELGKKAKGNLRSMGMALSSCIIPAKGKPTFELGPDEMEIGMGLHGEPGIERTNLKPADEVAEILTEKAASDFPLKGGEEVALLINGLGATPLMELYIIGRKVNLLMAKGRIKVYRTYVMEAATSMEMAGCSVSILKLDNELKELVDYPADTLTFKQF